MARRRSLRDAAVTDRATLEAAGKVLAAWVIFQLAMREKARRAYAVIGGEVLDSTAVVYHAPEAIR